MNLSLTFLLFKVFLCYFETIEEKSGIFALGKNQVDGKEAPFDLDRINFTLKNDNNTEEEFSGEKKILMGKPYDSYYYFFEVNSEQFKSLYSKISTDRCSPSILGTGYKKEGSVANQRFHFAGKVSQHHKDGYSLISEDDAYYLMSEDLTEDFAKSFYENRIKHNLKGLGEFFKKDNEKILKIIEKYRNQIDVKKIYEYLQNNYNKILSSSHNDFFAINFNFSAPENIELIKKHLFWLHELNYVVLEMKSLYSMVSGNYKNSDPSDYLCDKFDCFIKLFCVPGSFFSFKKNNIDLTQSELSDYQIVGINTEGEEVDLSKLLYSWVGNRVFMAEEAIVYGRIKSITLKKESENLKTSN